MYTENFFSKSEKKTVEEHNRAVNGCDLPYFYCNGGDINGAPQYSPNWMIDQQKPQKITVGFVWNESFQTSGCSPLEYQ